MMAHGACGELLDSRGLEGVPGLPGAPQDEAGLTRKFETSHEGLLFLPGLENNPESSLQTEEEAGLP